MLVTYRQVHIVGVKISATGVVLWSVAHGLVVLSEHCAKLDLIGKSELQGVTLGVPGIGRRLSWCPPKLCTDS